MKSKLKVFSISWEIPNAGPLDEDLWGLEIITANSLEQAISIVKKVRVGCRIIVSECELIENLT